MPSLPNLATCKKIGFIVPSSNTAVEPVTSAIFQSLEKDDDDQNSIICIFTRIPVRTLDTDPKSMAQFTPETLVAAAELLADAKPDAILWNGTSGMFVGKGWDEDWKLAKAMQDATGIPCSTTTLATVDALEKLEARSLSLAVPYAEALTQRVKDFFLDCGKDYAIAKVASLVPVPEGNLEIAQTGADDMRRIIRDCCVSGRTKAIVVPCTNWPASGLVEEMEKDLGVPIVDSIIVTAWMGLRMIGFEGKVGGWGKLMADLS